ncbi:tRNA A64-2'-O-ribosylphosphate transferase-like protein [Elsinoe fawcettii]|nr:tRNA A64-2'-O-ribosylphosphate transferase-like protein [Elsinoe fawcettii]
MIANIRPGLPDVSEIIFSSASQQISQFQRASKRSQLSVRSRLHSINHDAQFVRQVAEKFSLPLVANERCGSWYIDPVSKGGSVYFKSTDGHFGQWAFSLRRLNLNLLELVGKEGGCVIVDSTRRGKSMPDALSKTVPIWVAVWNRLLFPSDHDACTFRSPADVVGASEHEQIQELLHGLVKDLESLTIDLTTIRSTLKKPLRPIWVTQSSDLPETDCDLDHYPIVLCTASGRDAEQDISGFDYVQGAADDAEAWALGLTPILFWKHRVTLLDAYDDELPDLIRSLIAEGADAKSANAPVLIKPTSQLFVGSDDCSTDGYQAIIACCPVLPSDLLQGPKILHLPLQPGKLGSRSLRHLLPQLTRFITPHLSSSTSKILITCPTGKDHSIGVALTILCLYATDNGHLSSTTDNTPHMNKDFIKRRLSWIMASIPAANPSRATLQSVNAYLLG